MEKEKEVEVRYKKFFNPKLSDFLEDNKDISILKFVWAIYWRGFTVAFAIGFVIGIISEF